MNMVEDLEHPNLVPHFVLVDVNSLLYQASAVAQPTQSVEIESDYGDQGGVQKLYTQAIGCALNLLQIRLNVLQQTLTEKAAIVNGVPRSMIQENPDRYAVPVVLPVLLHDHIKPTFRHQMYPEYKAQREFSEGNKPTETEDGRLIPSMRKQVSAQRPYFSKISALLGMPQVLSPAFEADDLAYRYSEILSKRGFGCTVLTTDHDWIQMVKPGVNFHSLLTSYDHKEKAQAQRTEYLANWEDIVYSAVLAANDKVSPTEVKSWLDFPVSEQYPEVPSIVETLQQQSLPPSEFKFKLAMERMRHFAELARFPKHLRQIETACMVPFIKQIKAHLPECYAELERNDKVTLADYPYPSNEALYQQLNQSERYSDYSNAFWGGHYHVSEHNFHSADWLPRSPRMFVETKIIKGDTSDNLPGVRGLGEKSITSFFEKFESISEFYDKVSAKDPETLVLLEGTANAERKMAQILMTKEGMEQYSRMEALVDLSKAPLPQDIRLSTLELPLTDMKPTFLQGVRDLGFGVLLTGRSLALKSTQEMLKKPASLDAFVDTFFDTMIHHYEPVLPLSNEVLKHVTQELTLAAQEKYHAKPNKRKPAAPKPKKDANA